MVRPGYRLNDTNLLPIFNTTASQKAGFKDDLSGFRKVVAGTAIDWGRFIDIDTRPYGTPDNDKDPDNKTRLQFAYRIDTLSPTFLSQLSLRRLRQPFLSAISSVVGAWDFHPDNTLRMPWT